MLKFIKMTAVLAALCVSTVVFAGSGDGAIPPKPSDTDTTSCLLCGPVLQGGGGGTFPGDKD